mgnify:FL=1|tara:strand:+ start:1413 stop:2210 length:798 start_codon:yes stop_codon:yes gene_type:complete
MTTSLTGQVNKIKNSYGGSNKTSPSFLRPEYVKFNSPSKAKDYGQVVNLATTITGSVGTEVGANTLYFKFTTSSPSDIKINKNTLNKYENQYISIGLLNSKKDSIQLTPGGFAYQNEIINTDIQEGLLQLPQDTYYLTVSGSQWQALPFSVSLQIIRYILLAGESKGIINLSGRIALVKLYGLASGSLTASTTLTPKEKLKNLEGNAVGMSEAYGELAIMRGTIIMTNQNYGRLKMYWRVTGAATGTSSSTATLTSTPPYGGGYP